MRPEERRLRWSQNSGMYRGHRPSWKTAGRPPWRCPDRPDPGRTERSFWGFSPRIPCAHKIHPPARTRYRSRCGEWRMCPTKGEWSHRGRLYSVLLCPLISLHSSWFQCSRQRREKQQLKKEKYEIDFEKINTQRLEKKSEEYNENAQNFENQMICYPKESFIKRIINKILNFLHFFRK